MKKMSKLDDRITKYYIHNFIYTIKTVRVENHARELCIGIKLEVHRH